ncbi:MAG TPA: hypothetical protein ENJ18_07070 [Nannocystis exedens]|nr:hypothetical protein [Nannocystis exedens]
MEMSDRWRIVAGHSPDTWVLLLLIGATTVALVDAWQELRRPASDLRRRTRIALFLLRLLGIATLGVIIGELTIAVEQVKTTGPRIVVLVDSSASMALKDSEPGGEQAIARIDRLRRYWQENADIRQLWRESGLQIDVKSFARHTAPLTAADADDLSISTDGQDSDLTGALVDLSRAQETGEAPPLAAVIVLSDGLVVHDRAAEPPLISAAQALDLPITTISAGAPKIRDLAVRRAWAGEFAFVENVSEIEAEIVAHGLEGQPVTIRLERDGEVIAEKNEIAAADGMPLRLRFEVAPDRVGHFVYAVSIEPITGEATIANNRWSFVVKVLRDKVRVLHVAGRPDWDVRALRTLLGRDPNVELLSFYILRDLEDSEREDPRAPLSLIAFPTDQLFSDELGSFDLIVLHNFDALSHQVGRYLGDVARYVEEGGSLVVIGGDLGLATGDYKDSRLAAVLPVRVQQATGLETTSFRPEIAEAGRRHPITAWLSDPRLDGWRRLPALDSFNRLRLRASARGATTLLRHPDGAPLLAVAEPGRGRSVVLSTGASWRLGFAPNLPLLDGARPYDLLWLGIIRWLLRDAAADRLSLEVAPQKLEPGEAFDLRAATLSASYAPEPEVAIDWMIRPLDAGIDTGTNTDTNIDKNTGTNTSTNAGTNAGTNTGTNAGENTGTNTGTTIGTNTDTKTDTTTDSSAQSKRDKAAAVASGHWVTDSLGRARTRLKALPAGAYEALAHRSSPQDDTKAPAAGARRVLLVEAAHNELAQVDADAGETRLADLAGRTGGDALRARDGERLPTMPKHRNTPGQQAGDLRIESRREIPLWDGFGALILLVLAFGGEWILRRRLGLH